MFEDRSRQRLAAVGRLAIPKAADVLADELRARIRSGAWPEGAVLPSERELAQQAALSRTSVREALRILEVDGLVEIRPGRGGGARVRRPAGDELTRQLELFIWGRNIGVEHLHDVRTALETLGAEGAARHRTEADIADLVSRTEAVENAVGNLDRYLDANVAWHMAVARASHNELLVSIMEVLSNAIHDATEAKAFDLPRLRSATLKIHRAILEAIVAGDSDAARRRMARHVIAARDVALYKDRDHARRDIADGRSTSGGGAARVPSGRKHAAATQRTRSSNKRRNVREAK
jgi:DNA-binding FadR family transcriptional regulator